MEKEIGSIFPLETLDLSTSTKSSLNDFKSALALPEDAVLLSLGRESFSIVARNHPEVKRVLLPRYTCQTVCDPFVELGWKVDTYQIDLSLRINLSDIEKHYNKFKPSVVVFHPFYGTHFTQEEIDIIKRFKDHGAIVVIDYTQSVYYSKHLEFADYIVGSLRKWFDCPDGGYVYSNCQNLSEYRNLLENVTFVVPQTDSMYLRGVYFKTGDQDLKNISIRLNKQAVANAEFNIFPHRLSIFGINRLLNSSVQDFGEIRLNNYKYLYHHIHQSDRIKFVYKELNDVVSSPLYFPIYCEKRTDLQKRLARNKIYAPVLWPIPNYYKNIDNISLYIYTHILVIPIDQRYNQDDMRKICDVINNFSENNQ